MRWSWNINGQNVSNWEQLLDWGKQVRPSWTLIMDNRAKARQWKDEVGGEVTYRVWDQLDNYYHHSTSAIAAAERMARENDGLQDMWQYYRLNEAGGDWSPLQDWIIAFAEAARVRGFKTTTHGLAIMKNWSQPEWVQAGHVDKLIRYAYEHQDTFIINVHEYITGFAWSEQTPNYPANLFDHHLSVQGEITGKIDWTKYRPEFMPYFLGRVGWVTNLRAVEIVGTVLSYLIDEGLFDWHAAIHEQFVTLPNGNRVKMETELKARYGDDRYNRDIRGVSGSRRLFEWLATGQNNQTLTDEAFADVIMRNFNWAEKNYPPNCKGIMLFTMNEDWRYPEGHDYIPIANALLPRMKTLTSTEPPQEQPMSFKRSTITGINKTTNTPAGVNVRSSKAATNTSNIVVLIPKGVTVTGDVTDADTQAIGGYHWREIKDVLINNVPVSGFVADEVVVVIPLTEIPMFYDLDFPGQPTIRLTEAEFNDLLQAIQLDAARHAQIAEVYAALGTYLGSIEGQP